MDRRRLITGLITFVAAPAIVRAGSLMPVKVMTPAADYYICTGIMYSFNKHGIEHIYVESYDGKGWQHYKSPWLVPYDLQAPIVGDRKPEAACSLLD